MNRELDAIFNSVEAGIALIRDRSILRCNRRLEGSSVSRARVPPMAEKDNGAIRETCSLPLSTTWARTLSGPRLNMPSDGSCVPTARDFGRGSIQANRR